jgi:hypothetical protein
MAQTKRKTTKKPSTRKTRAKKVSSRKTTSRKTSSKRTSPKRTSTKRTSARRPSTSRTTRSTRSRKPKGLRLTSKKQKQILIIVAVIVALLLLMGFLQQTRTRVVQKKAGTVGEISRNAVYGKVISVNVGPVRKAIRVKSLTTGKVYTFYVGWRTKFYPDRWPSSGEKVKVYYVYDRGYLKATRVKIQ